MKKDSMGTQVNGETGRRWKERKNRDKRKDRRGRKKSKSLYYRSYFLSLNLPADLTMHEKANKHISK